MSRPRSQSAAPPACLNALRSDIQRIEAQFCPDGDAAPGASLGAPALDAALPAHGLALHGVHEVCPASVNDLGAANGFVFALMRQARLSANHPRPLAPLAVIQTDQAKREWGRMYGMGATAFGLSPAPWLFVHVRKSSDALAAAEEALRANALAGVAAEVDHPDFTATRRLSLAAQQSSTPLFLLCAPGREGATAAQTRWRVCAAPSADNPFDQNAPGAVRWRVTLQRARGGRPGAWLVEHAHETLGLCVVEDMVAGPLAARPKRRTVVHNRQRPKPLTRRAG